ncbi:MAG: hypothetical protein IKR57_01550 [Bacilli bacterium]|nr:hypothetical protein [Bacilli bacterium]MBR6690771.1 hypothetical protein [Bacilli bacterium]
MKKIKEVDLKAVRDTLEKMDNDKTTLGLSLLEEAEFMKTTLNNLKVKIKEEGVVVSMCQGKYDIDRANPALSQYNMMIKNYQTCVKNLLDIIPADNSNDDDEFDEDLL